VGASVSVFHNADLTGMRVGEVPMASMANQAARDFCRAIAGQAPLYHEIGVVCGRERVTYSRLILPMPDRLVVGIHRRPIADLAA